MSNMETNQDIDVAIGQLIGYTHAKRGGGIIELVQAMGLTPDEWEVIKANNPSYLNQFEKLDIEKHFKDNYISYRRKKLIEKVIYTEE